MTAHPGLTRSTDPSRLLFGGSTPRTREDFQRALLTLCAPFADRDGLERQLGAVGQPSAHYPPRVARLELLARLLWGIAPLTAGGGAYPGWQLIREEIVRGTDPDAPEFWGWAGDFDQRIVESAALGFALALCPGELWEPFTSDERARFADWLRAAARAQAHDNNWRLFATLINLGLRAVNEPYDADITTAAFARIDEFYHGGGWYSDGGEGAAFDHYGPWAIHFYSLISAALGGVGTERAESALARGREFAPEYLRWFASDGAGLAFGRSLTYRFAQASFFAALAFADEPGPGWGVLRGAWARHLRWWATQPAVNGDGTLSIGYGYPSLLMSEDYNAPGSPYWAFKAFLPLALPESHPFWMHEEEPLPEPCASVHAQPAAGLLLRGDETGHVTALSAAPGGRWLRHGEAKYGKFAYSTAFGFAVPTRALGLEGAGVDSMLAFSEEGTYWRVRVENLEWWVDAANAAVHACWAPWPDVEVETTLTFTDGWQVRTHRIVTRRQLETVEGAFCVPLEEGRANRHAVDGVTALVVSSNGASGIRDLTGTRRGAVLRPGTNGHLLWPRTLLPVLLGSLEPGEHRLVTGVFAQASGDAAGFASAPPGVS